MTLPYQLRPVAEDEFGDAAEWYERQRSGLGFDFRVAVLDVLGRIASQPRMYPVVHRDIRLAPVDGFSYVVCYRARPTRLVVVSVFHTSRDPAIWQGRV